MRRGATLIVAIGLTVTGIGSYSAIRTGSHGPRPSTPHLAAVAATVPPGPGETRVVRFAGYQIDVPATWPVYRLGPGSTRCVRYDRHAVYLGRPGANQQCPAHLVGRVATVSLQAQAPVRGMALAGDWHEAPARMGLAQGLARTGGRALQDTQDQELRAVVGNRALTITATYGGSPAQVARIIGSVRKVAQSTSRGGPMAPAGQATSAGTPPQRTAPAPANRSAGHDPGPPVPVQRAGFDTCTAPSLQAMQAWRPYYSAIAVYIGGPEAACGYGNLSPAWVKAVTRMGWSLIPTYVGPQAPCTKFRTKITVGRARVAGRAAADDAMRLARALGLRRGAPIYDDMEWFNPRKGICRRQVLSFVNAWTRRLHARGYRSGLYSSADSAARDLGRTSRIYGQRLAKPNSIWFALWDGKANTQGEPYLAQNWWRGRRRIKQYRGGHRKRIGGFTLNIDSDVVNGAVYR